MRAIRWALAPMAMFVIAVGLVACGDDDDDGGAGSDEVKVAFIPKSEESPFWQKTVEGAEAAAAANPNIDLSVDSGPSEAAIEEQIAIVEDQLTAGVQAIAIAPTAPDQLQAVLEEATADDVPVVVIDTDIPELSEKTAFVGTDNVEGGRVGAEYIIDQLGGKGTAGIITGSPGVTSVEDRVRGATEAFDAAGVEVVDEIVAEDCTRDNGVTAMEDMLSANPDIDAVFAACGEPAVAAVEVIAGSGRDFDDIVLVGFDATDDELVAIEKGQEDGSVAQFPDKMGELGVQAAYDAAQGEQVEPFINTGVEIVDAQNVEEFKSQ